MSQLFETIRVVDGNPQHLFWHEQRMNRSRSLIGDVTEPISLKGFIDVPVAYRKGIVRCNIGYGSKCESLIFGLYEKKSIRSLRLVTCNEIDYRAKYSDRSLLQVLLSKRGECDEIIIVKNGCITDTSMSNLIFLEKDHWVTPSSPLLRGTTRERLLAEGILTERQITPGMLSEFSACKLINAMRLPEEEETIPIGRIV
jgi:4-amino-4-deoxychorismate lyase